MNFNEIEKKRIMGAGVLFLIVLSVFLIGKMAIGWKEYSKIGHAPGAQNTISVSGEGYVFAVPDIARITFSVRQESKTVAIAQGEASKKINAAIAYLKTQGIDEKDIKTENYSAYPVYTEQGGTVSCLATGCPPSRPGKQVISGYTVMQTISVKVRKPDTAGALLDGIGKAGITDISGPEFTIDDDAPLQADARKKAIDDAKAKAEVLAKDLGVRLGDIVSFSESGGGYPMMYKEMSVSAAMAPQASDSVLPKGENKITSNVTIVYEIR